MIRIKSVIRILDEPRAKKREGGGERGSYRLVTISPRDIMPLAVKAKVVQERKS